MFKSEDIAFLLVLIQEMMIQIAVAFLPTSTKTKKCVYHALMAVWVAQTAIHAKLVALNSSIILYLRFVWSIAGMAVSLFSPAMMEIILMVTAVVRIAKLNQDILAEAEIQPTAITALSTDPRKWHLNWQGKFACLQA